jgi:putative ABC transport system substrate-binding protein
MDRRRFVAMIGGALAAPLARAQPSGKVWRIGFLSPDAADSREGKFISREFPVALRRHGYVEGRNLLIEWRWSDGQPATLKNLTEDLVRQNVDLIVARTTGPVAAAMAATRTLPIVMLNGNYPVENGLVQSLARPGGNVTGTAYASPETHEKLLQLVKELAPKTTRAAFLQVRPSDPEVAKQWIDLAERATVRSAERLGMSVQGFDVGSGTLEEVMAALEDMARSRIESMVYFGSPRYRAHQVAIADFLRRHRIASISIIQGFAEVGGLAHYAPDVLAIFDRTASYVDRILKGARPAELPVELPAKYVLAVNLTTAKALGLAVPQSILLRADRVIE